MRLKSVQIKNYRSIVDTSFEIKELTDNSYTYGLIGVNEVGKSSILKAIALKDGLSDKKGPLPRIKDFRDTNPIEVIYYYSPSELEINEFKDTLSSQLPNQEFIPASFEDIILKITFNRENPSQKNIDIEIPKLSIEGKNNVEEQLKQQIIDKSHKTLFWTAEERYLITAPINLSEFSNDPNISIPLRNCFSLLGLKNVEEIRKKLALLTDSTEREQLGDDLGNLVTEHINLAWPGHKIKITFNISDGLINFHVRDLNAKGKAKTADQRSDGFGQFVSYLLSISAQNKNEELLDSIILIDEPETHLHPKAQEDMLKELIKITQNKKNNLVFFATHSNHLIDKNYLGRNYRISKQDDKTEKEQLREGISTYASVTYEVFDIASSDYHNELYAKLHEKYQDDNPADQNRAYILNFDDNFLCKEKKQKKDKPWKGKANSATLSTYIRNCIHHPDNGDKYGDNELRKSIDLLKSYI